MAKPVGKVGTERKLWSEVHGCLGRLSVHAWRLWPLGSLQSLRLHEVWLQNVAHRRTPAAAIILAASVAIALAASSHGNIKPSSCVKTDVMPLAI